MPAKSLAQYIAMKEAEAGHSSLGIPQKVGADFVAATPRSALKGLPKKVKRNGAFAGPGEGLAKGKKKGEPPNLNKTMIPEKQAYGASSKTGAPRSKKQEQVPFTDPDAAYEDDEMNDTPAEEVSEAVPGKKPRFASISHSIMGSAAKAPWFGKSNGGLR